MKKPLLHHLQDYFFPHPRNNHRPHLFSVASIATIAALVIFFEAGYLVQTKFVFLKTDFLAAVLPGVLIDLTNESRVAYGVTPVTRDALLDTAAQQAAEDMALKGYFAHVSPDGKTPWYWLNMVGYRYSYAGENLAMNFTDSSDVQTAWMNSSSHRANIEKSHYTKIGIGVANGIYEGVETTFVVQFFATPVAETEKIAPARMTLAKSSSEKIATSSTSVQVLGSQTIGTDNSGAAAAAAPVTAQMSWSTRLLASPLYTLLTILSVLFTLIAISFTIAVLVRGRFQHPSVVIGGALLFVIISGAMFVGAGFAGSVQLPVDCQAASVYVALPN